jgi:hypothetical protein
MRILLLCIGFWLALPAWSQRHCATPDYIRQQISLNPALAGSYANEGRTTRADNTNGRELLRDTLPNEVIMIPVVVHVLYKSADQNISDAQVKSQIAVLNRDYRLLNTDTTLTPQVFRNRRADVRIQFCLAQVDPNGYRTNGIIHKKTGKDFFFADDGMKFSASGGNDAWDTKQYLNIWVCNMFGRVLGYGTPPGGTAKTDGVVIMYDVFGTIGNLRAPYIKGRTTTHEVGHWLGLKHLWGDADCGDDGIGDTPPQKSYNFGCPSFPRLSGCGNGPSGDMFMNFMDYSDDVCMNLFTQDQRRKMRGLFASGGFRNSMLVGFACDSTAAQGGPLPEPVPEEEGRIQVYPNPVHDQLTISTNKPNLLVDQWATLVNAQGKKVWQQQLRQSVNKVSFITLPAGIYFLQIGTGGKVIKIVRL